jgi:hypothetical protein
MRWRRSSKYGLLLWLRRRPLNHIYETMNSQLPYQIIGNIIFDHDNWLDRSLHKLIAPLTSTQTLSDMPRLLLRKLPDDASNKVTTFSISSSSDSDNSKTGRYDSKTKPPRRCVTQGVIVADVEALIFRSELTNSLMSDTTNMLWLQASTLHKGQQDDRLSTNSVCFPHANASSRWVTVDQGGSMTVIFSFVRSPSLLWDDLTQESPQLPWWDTTPITAAASPSPYWMVLETHCCHRPWLSLELCQRSVSYGGKEERGEGSSQQRRLNQSVGVSLMNVVKTWNEISALTSDKSGCLASWRDKKGSNGRRATRTSGQVVWSQAWWAIGFWACHYSTDSTRSWICNKVSITHDLAVLVWQIATSRGLQKIA